MSTQFVARKRIFCAEKLQAKPGIIVSRVRRAAASADEYTCRINDLRNRLFQPVINQAEAAAILGIHRAISRPILFD